MSDDGIHPGDIIRIVGYPNTPRGARYKVRTVHADSIDAWLLEHGRGGKLRTFPRDTAVLERREHG